ncbi:hybrid sensor histidine kinase/response regulator [Parageobacillus thermoglucosidasius]|uniref:hybrid sensor histidine kinase/response regulator n=1 Tax=Parageobacillus thermoglucosidasius TaxID=1426 RepID=UPI0021AB6AE5|nr:ATP-binding protein [Parageobacillus thermoglucosidasius]MED4905670.1 ATP-binding protein [Parageobacillus thermoglucosidasius]MED4914056.1 ATP-binding protein [Parageobacillus thermoglucosidasius]MED4945709.1 ATP-binding protein [Parageobacillus thermoglucosidasius]MED4981362.1 ATP-binding protein [Parageobacillus thermoglucosidasius]
MRKNAQKKRIRQNLELISRMSHELRTPLNGILGFAQLLEMDDSLNSQQQEFVQAILNGARHLLNLVNEMLDIARIETGEIQLAYDLIKLGSVIDESVKLIEPLAGKRNIKIVNQTQLDKYYVYTDSTRLRQILLNLLDNAVKYNRDNGTVTLTSRSEGGNICIHIKDSGIGIPKNEYENIFAPFYRIKGTKVDGTGMGLSLVKQLIQLMGGTIGVESEMGEGSDFWFSLPAVKEDCSGRMNLYQERLSQIGEKKILYIEDSVVHLKLMKKILEPFPNFLLISANFGKDGLKIIFREQWDLILVDTNLHDIGGYKVLEYLQEDGRTKQIPMIVFNAGTVSAEMEMLKIAKKGSKEYMAKPLEVGLFFRKLEQILTQK